MSNTISIATRPPRTSRTWRARIHAAFLRSEALRGYTLLSPTLLVMAFAMCAPFIILVAMSFWTQRGVDFDTTLSLSNYREVAEGRVYEALLIRSLWISGTCAFLTVTFSYPMAYYVAFHVHRRKLVWNQRPVVAVSCLPRVYLGGCLGAGSSHSSRRSNSAASCPQRTLRPNKC